MIHSALPPVPSRRRNKLPLIVTAWALFIIAGVGRLMQYELTPARAAAFQPVDWPIASARLAPIALASDRATLVVALHPMCPCSAATVSELETLVARNVDRVTTYVLFSQPDGIEEDARKTPLWEAAAAIPGVKMIDDRGGALADQFHATASGQTLLYDRNGVLRFNGGITGARGQVGSNAGTRAIDSILRAPTSGPLVTTPVFGCSIR